MTVDRTWDVAVRSRVIVDNDWSGDPDGLVALAHHLLSPSNEVLGVTSSFLHPMFDSPFAHPEDGARMARELVGLVDDPAVRPAVRAGAPTPFDGSERRSEAADAIVGWVRDAGPGVDVVCGGPLTNVADALLRAPDIVEGMRLVWIGGSLDPDRDEYNRDTDAAAAAFVLGLDGLEVVQFPVETYRQCMFSVAELEHDIGGSGAVGAWLWQRFLTLPLPGFVAIHGVWPLGDSPPLVVTALDPESSTFLAPTDGPGARVSLCTHVDVRLLVGDLLARLRLHEAGRTGR